MLSYLYSIRRYIAFRLPVRLTSSWNSTAWILHIVYYSLFCRRIWTPPLRSFMIHTYSAVAKLISPDFAIMSMDYIKKVIKYRVIFVLDALLVTEITFSIFSVLSWCWMKSIVVKYYAVYSHKSDAIYTKQNEFTSIVVKLLLRIAVATLRTNVTSSLHAWRHSYRE